MDRMTRLMARQAAAAVLLGLTLSSSAWAQERFKFSYAGAAQTKYTEQHVLDVGDMPGHQIRVATISTKYSGDAPVFGGVKETEATAWLTSDYMTGSGRFSEYVVVQLENGDKIYETVEGQLQTSGGKATYSTVTFLRGGTGKFAAIRGTIRGSGVTDFKTGPSANPSEGEYWFEK
jgi:hypothetical protein